MPKNKDKMKMPKGKMSMSKKMPGMTAAEHKKMSKNKSGKAC